MDERSLDNERDTLALLTCYVNRDELGAAVIVSHANHHGLIQHLSAHVISLLMAQSTDPGQKIDHMRNRIAQSHDDD